MSLIKALDLSTTKPFNLIDEIIEDILLVESDQLDEIPEGDIVSDAEPNQVTRRIQTIPDPLFVHQRQFSGEVTPDIDRDVLTNCLVLSQAAYDADPKSFLEDSKCQSHNFKSVFVSRNLACQFLLAEVSDDRAIYIAFRGTRTSNWDDILTDLDITLEQANYYPWFGLFHRGFLKRIELVPLNKIINSDLVGDKELVFCGHSMGGAVSSIAALYAAAVKKGQDPSFDRKIRNLTFGSPLIGDKQLDNWIASQRLPVTLQHFVFSGDPVPSLLHLTQTALYLKNKVKNNAFANLVAYLKPLVSFILNLGSVVCPSDPILSLRGSFEELNRLLDEESLPHEQLYSAIGNFYVLNERSGKRGRVVSVSPCEKPHATILDIFNFENERLSDLMEHHSISNYLKLFRMASYTKTDFIASRALAEIKLFQPKVEGGKLTLSSNKHNRTELAELELTGENIAEKEICLPNCIFDFGIPFGDENALKKSVPYNDNNCKKNRIRIKQTLDGQNSVITYDGCKIVIETVFGSCEFFLPKEDIHQSLKTSVPFGATDNTSLLLKVAIQRAKTFADVKGVKIQEETLFRMVLDLATSCLPTMRKISAWKQDLLEAKDEKIGDVTFFEPIEQALKEPIKLYVEKSKKLKWTLQSLALITSVYQYIDYDSLNACVTYSLTAAAGYYSAYKFIDFLASEEIPDNDYYIALRFVAKDMLSRNGNDTNEELCNLLLQDSTYSVEKAICIMAKNKSGNTFNETISQESLNNLKKRIALIDKTHEIRDMVSSQGIIGLVGPQNSGKTLFMNLITGSNYDIGDRNHTKTVQMKSISPSIAVVDFPGTNSLTKKCAQTFNKCGSISSVIVLIDKMGGDANKTLADEITKVYDIAFDPKYSKILICINKSWPYDVVEDDLKDKPDPVDFLKREYTDELNEHFKETTQSITINKDDIFFTDWKNFGYLAPKLHPNYKIFGWKEMKEQIFLRLDQLGIKIN